jgi:hypothetical protein
MQNENINSSLPQLLLRQENLDYAYQESKTPAASSQLYLSGVVAGGKIGISHQYQEIRIANVRSFLDYRSKFCFYLSKVGQNYNIPIMI